MFAIRNNKAFLKEAHFALKAQQAEKRRKQEICEENQLNEVVEEHI